MLRRATALKRICDRQRVQNAQIHELEKNIKIAVEDLQNEGKKIAFIKKGRKIIAVVGYKVA
jgi:hypothetical protein